MINVNLTEEEKRQLVEETNKMAEECDELTMDIMGYTQLVSRIGFYQRVFDAENKKYYKSIEKTIRIKSRRLLSLTEKIELNKEMLGIAKTRKKKKNKTL